MRAYRTASEEALLTRGLLKDWASEGFLTPTQYERMEQDSVCDLRRTNIFLRIVLFLFTMILMASATALFFVLFLDHVSPQSRGVFLLVFAAVSYAAAEFAVARAHLYRYGIEEALAACTVIFIYAGVSAILPVRTVWAGMGETESVAAVAGAMASLWIWHRFGLWYAFLAAMVFVCSLPDYWRPSPGAQHVAVAAIYFAGLVIVGVVRSGNRCDLLDEGYSTVEALLWLGIYLAINLQLSSLHLLEQWWRAAHWRPEFSMSFYWTTWVLIWLLPPAALWRGLRGKDRLVIGAGALMAILTLVTNKPYLGWERHTWDPMLLGAVLTGAALRIRRWISNGPGGIRRGFTAQRLSGRDKRWMNVGSLAIGLVAPETFAPSPQTGSPHANFGGGDAGGGGASSDY